MAKERSILLERVIAAVTRCGVRVTNVTSDGKTAKIPALKKLGAKLKIKVNTEKTQSSKNLDHFKPFILNPVTNEKIYIILDPCHKEDKNGKKIEWRFIEQLHKYSCSNDFHTHELTKKHIEWKRHAMNVRLAAETFSESVASSIQFLMEKGVPEFQGAQATIDFIRRMNTIFDIFNSRYSTH